jgi:hypothetical protein
MARLHDARDLGIVIRDILRANSLIMNRVAAVPLDDSGQLTVLPPPRE